jgi:hypothetical protein
MAATFLGVACHLTCAPLNPAYGATELEFYLTDLAAKAVVKLAGTDQAVRDVAIRLGLMVLDVEAFKDFGGDDRPPDDSRPALEKPQPTRQLLEPLAKLAGRRKWDTQIHIHNLLPGIP